MFEDGRSREKETRIHCQVEEGQVEEECQSSRNYKDTERGGLAD